jgi:hypothetical protein
MFERQLKLLSCFLCLILVGCGSIKQQVPQILPTITPVPGWHLLEKLGFQVWLPPSYLGGSNTNIDQVNLQLEQKGPNFAKITQSLQQGGTRYVVFAVDTDSNPSLVTYMLVGNEKLLSPVDMSSYLDLLSKNLIAESSLFSVIQKVQVTTGRYPTGKIIVELNTVESGDIKQVVYVEQNGGMMWQISFTSPTGEFDSRSTIFDQIARSVSLPYTPELYGPTSPASPFASPVVILIVAVILIIGLFAWYLVKRRPKKEPVRAVKINRKKRAKK